MLTTDQKGAIAETAIAHAATTLGIEVYRPIAEGGRFDMIFLLCDDLVRVQCKWARRHGDVIIVRCYRIRSHIQLRLGPTKNNQTIGVHWADDFEFAATLAQPQGAVAQLGERRAGSA